MTKIEGGYFISFEGGEGSGKTTQINRLAKALTAEGYKVVTTREPGGTDEAEKIRELLVQRDGGEWLPMSEALMMFAARAMHVDQIIRPAMETGRIVISDRFTDSTRAYQGYGLGVPLEAIDNLNKLVIDDLTPHLTLVLDIDPKTGLHRAGRRQTSDSLNLEQLEDRYENMDFSMHERLRAGFLDIAEKEPDRCRIIDAAQELDDVSAAIEKTVKEALDAYGSVR